MATTGRRVLFSSTRLTSTLHDCPLPICLKWIHSFSIEAPTFSPWHTCYHWPCSSLMN
jgi:hypothetical protein